jgi:phosphate uptake regulator
MLLAKSIRDNLHFLIAEVSSQVYGMQSFIDAPSLISAQRILDRGGYVYNLKTSIHSSCLRIIDKEKLDVTEKLSLKAIEFIAADLERIAEICRDCVKQMLDLNDMQHLQQEFYRKFLSQVILRLDYIEPALRENDTKLAVKIGQLEQKFGKGYKKIRNKYIVELKQKKQKEEFVTSLFITHEFEQIGDILLSISESIISANLGQPINIDRYVSLQASIEQFSDESGLNNVNIEHIAETRSGSGLSAISSSDEGHDGYVAIFKEGKKSKVKEERDGVENWHEIYPGLAPRILSYHKQGPSAALLIEHLNGATVEQILLHESKSLLEAALNQLRNTLKSVWKETYTEKVVWADFMGQLLKRLDAVYSIHPEFRQSESFIGEYKFETLDSLVNKARKIESQIKVPFSVYIHGDFNLDNIIYDPVENRINFIDLHRSRYMDYVQDISVFMVSNYRLQILDTNQRRKIMGLAKDFYTFAARQAKKYSDDTFEIRLALGLARSFASSTRFILDKSLARAMFLRARYLIEKVLNADLTRPEKFELPIEEVFIG